MTADPLPNESLTVFRSVCNEIEAALIVNTLKEHGIPATAAGGFTSGFKAEAPGDVRVLVKQSDLLAASEVLDAAREFDIP